MNIPQPSKKARPLLLDNQQAIDGKGRLITHLQALKRQDDGMPIKPHDQSSEVPEEGQAPQAPYEKHGSASLSVALHKDTWAEHSSPHSQNDCRER